jgi:hypothetical protein
MTPAEQDTQWRDLVAWVVWIHDLYELSKEERLPLCWPRHPGLIEELRSLKAWRETIYGSSDTSAAHSARSWHGELRQSITAAGSFWAPTCRAGHTDASCLAEMYPSLAEEWLAAGAPSIPTMPVAAPVGAGELSDADMTAALSDGRAQPHSRAMPYYAQLDGMWWTRSSVGATWLPCVDPGHHSELDSSAARMRAAEAALDQLRQQ